MEEEPEPTAASGYCVQVRGIRRRRRRRRRRGVVVFDVVVDGNCISVTGMT